MTERGITIENAYTQQNYRIQLCMGYTDRLNELEVKYHKMQAKNWHHRAKQLKAANRALHDRADALQNRIDWYRARYRELKEENERLRSKLARYAELEKVLSEGRG
jgi:DNA repair exonuclease SbcCD ATPase subunit